MPPKLPPGRLRRLGPVHELGLLLLLSLVMQEPCYSVQQTPHAGRGVFAARHLVAGSIVMSEKPLRATSCADLEHVARASGALEDLCGSDASSQVAHNHFVYGGHCLLFRRISLLNHSCVPNASIHFSDNKGNASVILARDVAAAEEITLCYSGEVIFAVREVRQAELYSNWNFTCRCARCLGTLAAGEADMWLMLESAAHASQATKPRGPVVEPSIHAQQCEALAVLEAKLPYLCERERFRFDAEYFL